MSLSANPFGLLKTSNIRQLLGRGLVVLVAALAMRVLPAGPAGVASAQDLVRDAIPQKWIEPLLPESLPALKYPAYFDDVDKAKAQAHAGRYKLSLATLRKVKEPKPEQRVTVALTKGRALAALGRTDEGLAALSDAAKAPLKGKDGTADAPLADHPRVQLLKAEVLADAGKPQEALDLLKAHLKAYPDSWGGHYFLGTVSEQIGDTETAKTAYGWFTDADRDFLAKFAAQIKLPEFESAENVVWMGRSVDRWATLAGKYEGNNALPKQIVNVFVKAQFIDADYWPAHLAACEYFLGHENDKDGTDELKAALKANPQDIGALRLRGQIAVEHFDFDTADAVVDAIRRIDPDSTVADLLEARCLLQQRRPQDAAEPVDRVLAARPKDLKALGLKAAVFALQLREDEADKVLKQVDEIDVGHDNASAYLEVAEQLSAMRQYPRAAAKYIIARDRAPWWTAVHNGLGLLYTQSGDEDKAKLALEQARKLDPFNFATTNYMRLLDDMARFERVETPHFVVMFDKAKDPIIGEYFPEYLESIHHDVTGHFNFEPKVTTYIEVFPGHDAFSVRTTGSPWIGTVGASTGRVIAMVSPRKGGSNMEPYNWAQVLRHEYTHTVTLGATDNRIQHWMTEGLAVYEEQSPVRWEWVPMLYSAVKGQNGLKLFTMDNLTWGFVRPKKPTDRQLAYAQSWWICEYVEETYGHDAILKMIDLCREAKTQEEMFQAVTGKPTSSFYADFVAWCNKKVDAWGYDKETSAKYDKLKKEAEAAKDAKQYDKATELWEQIIKIRPVDSMPHQRLAGLYLRTKQYDKSIEHLSALDKVEIKDNRYAKQIAIINKAQKKWPEAEKEALRAVYMSPYDLSAHELLAEISQNTGNAKLVEREQRVIPVLTQWLEQQKKANSLRGGDDAGDKKPDGT